MYNRIRRIFKGSEEKKFLSSLDLNEKVVYDIGAWTGKGTTLLFSNLVGETGLVYAFEPLKSSFYKLIRNTRSRVNVVSFQIGLGSKKERREMFVPLKTEGRASMDRKIQKSFLKKGEIYDIIETPVYALDKVIEKLNLRFPDFIKIDTEGMESEILLGTANTIYKCKPQLLIELHGADRESKIVSTHKILTFLLSMNYNLYHVETKRRITNIPNVYEGHIFAYKTSSKTDFLLCGRRVFIGGS